MHITYIDDQEQSLNRRTRSTDTAPGETYVMKLEAHEQEGITQVVITHWLRWSDELVANTIAINGMRFFLAERVLYIVVSDAIANIIFGGGKNTDISPIQSLSKREEEEGENVGKDTSSLSVLLHDAQQWQEHQWLLLSEELAALNNQLATQGSQVETLIHQREQRATELSNELDSISKQIVVLSQEVTSSNSRQSLDGSTMHYLLEGAFRQLEQKVYTQLRSESDRHERQVELHMSKSQSQILASMSKIVRDHIEPGEPPKPEGTFMRLAIGAEVYEGYMKPVKVTLVEDKDDSEEEEDECWLS